MATLVDETAGDEKQDQRCALRLLTFSGTLDWALLLAASS
jgi:hypothetical protein